MSFRCPFVGTRLAVYHSIVGILLARKSDYKMPTYVPRQANRIVQKKDDEFDFYPMIDTKM